MNIYRDPIKVKQISFSDEHELVEDRGQSIEFYDSYAVIRCSGLWKVEDLIMGKKTETVFDNTLFVPKECYLERTYEFERGLDKDIFTVHVDEWRFFFYNKEDAEELFNKILNWKVA